MSDRTQIQTKTERPSFSPSSALAASTNLLQRQCACGGTPGVDGVCAECRKTRLQRRASNHAKPETAPPVVHETLRSLGQPLDADTRAFMEPRLGHDFSKVRIHSDEKAAASARAVNALAYTVGRDVVFGSGQYALGTGEGQRLLTHELAHVVQQREASANTNRLAIAPATGPAEAEAARAAHAVSAGDSIDTQPRGVTGPTLARQAAPAFRPPAFRPPVPEVEPIDPLAGQGGPRYAPVLPSDATLEEILAHQAFESQRRRDIAEAERPVATLDRGGAPPTFITVEREELGMWEWGTVRYQRRRFHILDFIEHHAEHARDEDALVRVYEEWVQPHPAQLPLILPGTSTFPLLGLLDTPNFPPGLDPGSQQRREAYTTGEAKRRLRTQPKPAPEPALEPVPAKPRIAPPRIAPAEQPTTEPLEQPPVEVQRPYLLSPDAAAKITAALDEIDEMFLKDPDPSWPPDKQALFRRCAPVHNTYKADQEAADAVGKRKNPLLERIDQNQASPQDLLTFCLLLDEQIRFLQREAGGRAR